MKASVPISSRESGRETSARAVHFWKARVPMRRSVPGSITARSARRPAKASSPMISTPSGTTACAPRPDQTLRTVRLSSRVNSNS